MKCFNRLLTLGSLALLVTGVSLGTAPVFYAAEKKAAIGQEKEQGYVASLDGDKYHKTSCRMVKKIKAENKVVYASKAEAEKAGKTPCGICKP